MMRSMLIGIAGATVVMLAAGAARPEAMDPTTSPFAAVGKQYVEAYNRKNAAAVAALFTDDAVRVNAQGIIRGREAIHNATQAALDAGGRDLNLQYHETHVDGNTGWSVAEANFQVRGQDGKDLPAHVLATSFWIQSGGVWKIRAQSLVNAPPPKQ